MNPPGRHSPGGPYDDLAQYDTTPLPDIMSVYREPAPADALTLHDAYPGIPPLPRDMRPKDRAGAAIIGTSVLTTILTTWYVFQLTRVFPDRWVWAYIGGPWIVVVAQSIALITVVHWQRRAR